MSGIQSILDPVALPRMARISQEFERPRLADPAAFLGEEIRASGLLGKIAPGDEVGITAGSRGITLLPEITREVVRAVRSAGGKPFIFPAMGSHGGATAEGQEKMLRSMGLTEEFLEAPIRSSMEVVEIGRTPQGFPVYQDRFAHEAKWVVPINRIKPHTTFRGKYESGLAKMLVIGMGKQKGAEVCHSLGPDNLGKNLEEMVGVVNAERRTLFGVAVIENAFHDVARLAVLDGDGILEKEPDLLAESCRLIPRIPFEQLDCLIVDEIGKDISGTGVDPNIIGRYTSPHMFGGPSIVRVAALNMTEKTKGNGNGMGLMDFITKKIFSRLNFEETYLNCLTSTITASVKIPMVLDNDRLAIQAAIKTCNRACLPDVRLVRIRNTLALSRLWVSENLLPEAAGKPLLHAEGDAEWRFDGQGNLASGEL